jgi:hypothetical protein
MKYVSIEGDVAFVELTQGFVAKIDAVDAPEVMKHSWHIVPNEMGGHYARRSGGTYLHRFLLDAPKGMQVDHINHDTLDNRRSNLRIVTTNQQNNENRNGAHKNSKTGIRGVTIHKCKPSGLMYSANVQVKGKACG